MIIVRLYFEIAVFITIICTIYGLGTIVFAKERIIRKIKEIFSIRVFLIIFWVFVYAGLGWLWHLYKLIIE